MERYRKCLRGAGADNEFPRECTMEEFMVWLLGEMDALDSHMMLGCDFAAITAFKAIGHSLVDAGCTHLPSLEIKESNYYSPTACALIFTWSLAVLKPHRALPYACTAFCSMSEKA